MPLADSLAEPSPAIGPSIKGSWVSQSADILSVRSRDGSLPTSSLKGRTVQREGRTVR
jgi:hypothetical protein